MNWKFWEREERQQPYSDAIVAAIAGGATGGGADAKTAIREACAALWARAFASGTVSPANPATAALNPKVLALIGRELYSTGEVVFDIRVAGGRVALQSAASWSIVGLDTWSYELNMPQPSGHLTRFRPAAGVVHLRYADPPGRPWEGVSPAANASATHSLAGAVEKRLAQELDMPVGAVLPVPDTEAAGGLQSDISALEGKTVLVPSTAGGWDQQTGSSALASDWQPRRLGANPPATLEEIRRGAGADIAAAAGVPAPLLSIDADGTSRRESWRQFLHGTIQPVADIISPELADKLDTPDLSFDFDKLFASDLSGRARAFQSMVGGGLDVAKAAALAGLMEGAE